MAKTLHINQKDIDSIKTDFGYLIQKHGGSVVDEQRKGSCVMTYYRIGKVEKAYKWHSSYSDRRANRQIRKHLRHIARDLGIEVNKKENPNVFRLISSVAAL